MRIARIVRRGSTDAGFSPWGAASGKGDASVVWYGSPSTDAEAEAAPWYFYWAKVRDGHLKTRRITSGTTTAKPIFEGLQQVPEFEMIRLDNKGRMHIGVSAYFTPMLGARPTWAIYYQRQSL